MLLYSSPACEHCSRVGRSSRGHIVCGLIMIPLPSRRRGWLVSFASSFVVRQRSFLRVKNNGREESGKGVVAFCHGRRQGKTDHKSNGHPRGWPSSHSTIRLYAVRVYIYTALCAL